jgi:hypothetical protein
LKNDRVCAGSHSSKVDPGVGLPFAALIASRKEQSLAPLVSEVVSTVKFVARAGDAIVTASTAIIAVSPARAALRRSRFAFPPAIAIRAVLIAPEEESAVIGAAGRAARR